MRTGRVLETGRDPACWGILMAPRKPVLHSFIEEACVRYLLHERHETGSFVCNSSTVGVGPLLSDEKCDLQAWMFEHIFPSWWHHSWGNLMGGPLEDGA